MNIEAIISSLIQGDRTSLARAITLVESNLEKHQLLADKVLSACQTKKANSIRIAVTGVPGVGKSTFIESFGKFLTKKGKKLRF